MRYLPHTQDDLRNMLQRIGVQSVETLFDAIPEHLRLQRPLELPEGLDEVGIVRRLSALAEENRGAHQIRSFAGAGLYFHYSPAVINELLLRPEFYTAYTPYQPEVSQGTLQAMYEYQTMVCRLLGVEVSNASMYDGSTAFTEAVLMARRLTRNRKLRVVVTGACHPEYLEVLRTYMLDHEENLVLVPPAADGRVDAAATVAVLDGETAAVAIQSPNAFGIVEDIAALAEPIHASGALVVSIFTDPTAFGLLEPPGACGADIVAGEGQSLGLPVNLGGPLLGILGGRKEFVRSMPGRLIGKTVDRRGEIGYVVTLSTREQHIRRERATSNICSNEGLCALGAAIYMTLMGPQGLSAVARMSHGLAVELRDRLTALPGVEEVFPGAPVYNEFALRLPGPAGPILDGLAEHGIAGGVSLGRWEPGRGDQILVACTETTRIEDLDAYVSALQKIL
ncbi:MAG: aminomethyl-transferring glycine dehydrogenase subunit GcvPA [Pseudomonadota bacterium]